MLRADGDLEVPEVASSHSRQVHYERQNLETTPQMHALDSNQRNDLDEYYGRNVNDHSDINPLPPSNGVSDASTNSKSWFPSLWTSSRKPDRPDVALNPNGERLIQPTEVNGNGARNQITEGKPLDSDPGIIPGSPKRRSRRFPHIPSSGQQMYATIPSSSAIQESSGSNVHFSALPDASSSSKVTETELQENCSFFFRPLESDSNPSSTPGTQRRSQHDEHQHVWKVMRRDHHNRHPDALTYEYSDAVPVTPLPILQHYRSRFAQLNQELLGERLRLQQHYHHHDRLELERDPFDDWHLKQSSLQLQEYDSHHDEEADAYYNANLGMSSMAPKNNRGIVRSDTARQSSLFFRADGRLLMRLPRDRVRLLVDPDLEVGVLSVEQWRVETEENDPHDDEFNFCPKVSGADGGMTDTESSFPRSVNQPRRTKLNRNAQRPELRYVLTVNDDLFRKIVEEMSPTSVKYFCCNRACCNDEEKVDIRVAFFLLLAILFILFINMLAFREH